MANEGLWQQLLKLDGQQTARRAKCRYFDDPSRYILRLLNTEYTVDVSDKRVVSAEGCSAAGYGRELCILAYLINSRDLPITGKLAPPESLPGGQFFFRGPHVLASEKLEKAFGRSPKKLHRVGDGFGAKRCDFGDASIQLYVLPRVPLTIVIWRADEEFAARASILFDETAADQMPLDALWMAANITVKALVEAAESAG
jgi:hypothetical protein